MRTSISGLLLAATASGAVQAAQGAATSEYGFAGDGGLAAAHQSLSSGTANATRFAMAPRGGSVASPRLRFGLEPGGVLLQASDINDPSRWRGISQMLVVSQVHPSAERDSACVRAWLAHASFQSQHVAHGSGWGGSVAIRQGLWTNDYDHFGPGLSLAGVRAGGVDCRAVSLGLNWSTP